MLVNSWREKTDENCVQLPRKREHQKNVRLY